MRRQMTMMAAVVAGTLSRGSTAGFLKDGSGKNYRK